MRRYAIFTAGAALVVGSLAIPGMAVANGKTATADQNTTISAQGSSLDTPIAAQGKGHGHSRGHGHSHGYRHGRSRHGHSHGRGWFGRGYGYWGYGYGGYWPGYSTGYGYPGYWGGGFGCNFDYPCGPPFDEQCRSFRGAPAADPKCQAQSAQPAPGQSAQPAPGQSAQPAPDAEAQPAPSPAPEQGGTEPRPY